MEEELEILESIYNDDILDKNLHGENPSIEVLIYPPNSENEEDNKKNIILTLIIKFSKNYPNEIPKFEFKNVKGIIDQDIKEINVRITEIAAKNIGEHMLFEIIQDIKDFLNSYGNVPKSCKCSICLNNFEDGTKVTHLDCYHYFHTSCLSTFLAYALNDIEDEKREAEMHKIKWKDRTPCCPECRQSMNTSQIEDLKQFNTIRQTQAKMKILFEKQKKAGGIIEPKEDFIIVLNRAPESEPGT
ncbi:unnamed protein product [Brachionus calyciflorus]|uniref:Uncharacterized protein n=1 Tax=Brachionus calyciflorus TaxID=104777 RepID=A0A813M7R7_9BILA|nr:unnamed protein product [Brachionus calyciflorus]